jgi:hypothetical protein
MKVSLVFEPDSDLGPDPLDTAHEPRRLGEFYDTNDPIDLLLFVRVYGEQYEGGYRTHVWASGAWEHVRPKQLDKILQRLGEV